MTHSSIVVNRFWLFFKFSKNLLQFWFFGWFGDLSNFFSFYFSWFSMKFHMSIQLVLCHETSITMTTYKWTSLSVAQNMLKSNEKSIKIVVFQMINDCNLPVAKICYCRMKARKFHISYWLPGKLVHYHLRNPRTKTLHDSYVNHYCKPRGNHEKGVEVDHKVG